jgi:hypothetical protein
MALGTGAVAAAAADTTITEIATSRKALVVGTNVTKQTGTGAEDTIQYVATWAAGEATNSAIAEAGLFTGPTSGGTSSGILLARTVFASTINKTASDSLTVTWRITLNATGT